MKKAVVFTLLVLVALSPSFISAEEIEGALAPYLQSISVTIRADRGQGSGVLVTREMIGLDGKPVKVNFVWTAAHVLSRLRKTRTVIDTKTGQSKTLVEFRDAEIVQEIVENGRRVGEKKMLASVIKYSDADEGQDLALLMVRKIGMTDKSAVFYDGGNDILPIGTKVFHVGSLHGQFGANSMTDGIMSQIGRVLNIGSAGGGVVFDQTTVNAFPGSSGGGVFVAGDSEETKKFRGQYCGMIVRGAGETFNLIVPIRRMRTWAKAAGCEWAIKNDPKITPPLSEIYKPGWIIEDTGGVWNAKAHAVRESAFFFWLRDRSKVVATILKPGVEGIKSETYIEIMPFPENKGR
tara:strand:- start:8328 stop:9377 length:1050 start_codon:yes stop_codon:yes gene_type:complete